VKYIEYGEIEMSKKSRKIYKFARTINDLETLASGDPKRIARRARNKVLGRMLGKLFRF